MLKATVLCPNVPIKAISLEHKNTVVFATTLDVSKLPHPDIQFMWSSYLKLGHLSNIILKLWVSFYAPDYCHFMVEFANLSR